MYYRFNFMDSTKIHQKYEVDLDKADMTAYEAAKGGIVLLKNDGNILPLDTKQIKSIAVIGPNGDPAVAGGGGSGYVTPVRSVSLFEALKQISGVNVQYAPGMLGKLTPAFYRGSLFDGEAKAEFFKNMELKGEPSFTRNYKSINAVFSRPITEGFDNTNFSARWRG